MSEPSTSEFLNAANWTYTRSSQMPDDLQPFLVGGKQLTMQLDQDGFYAAAFLSPADQVVIAYEGTSPASTYTNPTFALAQLLNDINVYLGQNIAAYTDAASFADQVVTAAKEQGIPASNVFITGHSLGGAETAYVAATLGLSGETFGAPGIPSADVTANPGQLLNYVEYGDPVGNYASQPPVEGNFIYSPNIMHVGAVQNIGASWQALPLQIAGRLFGTSSTATAAALGLLAAGAANFHLPPVYAADLGVTLTNPDLVNGAPVTAVADTFTDGGTSVTMTGTSGADLYVGTTGNDTITTAAVGAGLIAPGSGHDLTTANGYDTISPASGGSDTIFAVGHVFAAVGAGAMTFINGENSATVLGGANSASIAGGAGGGQFAGGASGDNLIVGGAGAATIFGGGGGDQLFAAGSSGDVIAAGQGNETLSGLNSSGNDVFFGGSGNDIIGAGAGADTIFAGSGSATMIGGEGPDVFAFVNGQASGADLIYGFNAGQGDQVALQDYDASAVASAISTASLSGGNEAIHLPDGTNITFAGVTNLNGSSFAVS